MSLEGSFFKKLVPVLRPFDAISRVAIFENAIKGIAANANASANCFFIGRMRHQQERGQYGLITRQASQPYPKIACGSQVAMPGNMASTTSMNSWIATNGTTPV